MPHSYMLLLHERPADDAGVSPSEMQEIVARYQAWAGELAAKGLLAGGEKLCDDGGRILRLQAGQPVATDGPYAEAHDVVGGYFTILAEDDEQAVAIARGCPHLRGQRWIEIRRVDPVGG